VTDAATRLTALAERIELWPVERLRPYERNPRTHGADQVAQLAASMVEFGFTNPILVDGERGVIAGHGRLLAARKLGMSEVPVIELAHLTEAQKRAYVLADNRLALSAGWGDEMLRLELSELRAEGFDLALTGFGEGCASVTVSAAREPPLAKAALARRRLAGAGGPLFCRDRSRRRTTRDRLAGCRRLPNRRSIQSHSAVRAQSTQPSRAR
jgi:ParB-like chromosome segregation protein Spo0J